MKTVFKDIEIVNVKFDPFRENRPEGTEFELLSNIANSIINIRNKLRRKRTDDIGDQTGFHFSQSETLIALDLTAFKTIEVSLLEHLSYAIYLYPFICINSPFTTDQFPHLKLQEELSEQGYILPVFPSFSAYDYLYTAKRYGDSIKALIEGTIPYVLLENITNDRYSSQDLFERFNNFTLRKNKLFYHINVVWLGVTEPKISTLLNDLFNNNEEEFLVNDKCKKYDIEEETLRKYTEGYKMLFDSLDGDKVQFRLVRKNVILKIKDALSQEFEDNLFKHSVIDTTASIQNKFKKIKEVHDLGKLFDPTEQTYAIKLLSLLRNKLGELSYDRIVLVENGSQQNLFYFLETIFQKPISRIVSTHGQLQRYPFDDYPMGKQRVIVVIDVCNTGDCLENVIEYLNVSLSLNIVGAITFIVNTTLDINKYRNKHYISNEFKFIYFVEKDLQDVKTYVQEKQFELRAKNNQNESYLLFWDLVNRVGDVDIALEIEETMAEELVTRVFELALLYYGNIKIREDAGDKIKPEDDFIIYVAKLIKEKGITACLINTQKESSKFFPNLLKKVDDSVEIFHVNFDKPSDKIIDIFRENRFVLLYNTAFNIGISTVRLLNFIQNEDSSLVGKAVALFLFSRQNITLYNKHIVDTISGHLNQFLAERLFVYYKSNIPFCCYNVRDNERDKLTMRILRKVDSWRQV